MPFKNGARLTIENTSTVDVRIYYQVTFEVGGDYSNEAYLHAQWRRSNPTEYLKVHTLLECVEGRGQHVGTYIAWGVNSNGWWGEGEIKFYLDGEDEYPTIAGTGTEDYFGGAWNFDIPGTGYTEFSTPYFGMPQVIRPPDSTSVSSASAYIVGTWSIQSSSRSASGSTSRRSDGAAAGATYPSATTWRRPRCSIWIDRPCASRRRHPPTTWRFI